MQDSPAAPVGADRKTQLEAELRRRILTMAIAPGAVLDEVALAAEFGLSRPPVRETMRQLAGEGFIELEANRAARAAAMGYRSLHEFFTAAPMIYVATTRLAAQNRNRRQLETLKGIQRGFVKAVADLDLEARVFHNDAFHLQIGEMAHNIYLMPSLRRLLIDHARIGMIFYRDGAAFEPTEDLKTASSQHDAIIAAIEAQDPATAENLIRAHLDLARRNAAEYATPDGIDVPV